MAYIHKMNDIEGFAATGLILVSSILALVLIAGYSVYETHRDANNVNQTAKIAKPPKPLPKEMTSGMSMPGYFAIKEWRIKAPYKGPLNLTYKIIDDKAAKVSSAELAQVSKTCKSDGVSFIYKIAPSTTVSETNLGSPTGNGRSVTIEQAAADMPGAYLLAGGNYYYYGEDYQDCYDHVQTNELMNKTRTAVKNLLPQLTAY